MDNELEPPRPASPESTQSLLQLFLMYQLRTFDRYSANVGFAPDFDRHFRLAQSAGSAVDGLAAIAAQIEKNGSVPHYSKQFEPSVDTYHGATVARDWLEVVVKLYVGGSIARDFFHDAGEALPEEVRDTLRDALAKSDVEEFAAEEVRTAIAGDETASGRLSLWGRRIAGEALNLMQQVVSLDAALGELAVPDGDVAGLVKSLNRRHQERMKAVGLNN
ncbi:ferritin-like fold-containing protein [Salininema proteolyticum]|uniref:Ferritin-like fold-containing protein n=1 Tax=Salininema proteolyticum TaxID=1607685 RepID=A0ABV8U5L5_9ACTN